MKNRTLFLTFVLYCLLLPFLAFTLYVPQADLERTAVTDHMVRFVTSGQILLGAWMLFVFCLAYASGCMKNGCELKGSRRRGVIERACSVGILIIALYLAFAPMVYALTEVTLHDMAQSGWIQFLLLTGLVSCAPLLAGRHLAKRTGDVM